METRSYLFAAPGGLLEINYTLGEVPPHPITTMFIEFLLCARYQHPQYPDFQRSVIMYQEDTWTQGESPVAGSPLASAWQV